ncbi:hypothetical protein SERLA73DRAFT_176434 [Serpula lacrymans var. lacrymans S7.3]|uniref:Uncharacterized protein n=1 Tax=Serpula lacrymans var. lacrymans (strain S7.3) TaxID=936435 RepID=F8PMW8_SERL3|nr:hypothetical protein SERLA73DRAFT_176434 [Serpula lacrymans var. lacrymans S7.3]
MAGPSASGTKKPSRLLAALDDSGLFGLTPNVGIPSAQATPAQLAPQKRKWVESPQLTDINAIRHESLNVAIHGPESPLNKSSQPGTCATNMSQILELHHRSVVSSRRCT